MLRTHALVSLLVGGLFVGTLSGVLTGQVSPSAPPPTAVRPVTETLHGVAVTDPYRWMEYGGQEFTDWLKAQDAYARAVLERIPGREKLAADKRAAQATNRVGVTRPRRAGNRYFYRRQRKLYAREATSETEFLVVDPAILGDGKQPYTISDYSVSPDGRYVAYTATTGGSREGILRVADTATGRALPDTIDRVLYFNSWRPDSRALTYTRLRPLPPGAPEKDAQKCPTTYLHIVETAPDSDRPLVGCGVTPRIPIAENQWGGVFFSTASPYALAWVALGSARTAVDFYTAPLDRLAAGDIPWHRLAGGDDEVIEAVLRGDTAYLRTGRGAPRGQVVRTSVLHPDLPHAEVVVAQSEAVIARLEPDAPFQSALYLAKDALYVRMRDAGIGRLVRVPFETSRGVAVPLPFAGSIGNVSASPGEAGIAFVLESWTRAPRVYEFDPKSGTVRDVGLTPRSPAERDAFEVTQVKVRSADGVLVPLTIIGGAGLKKDKSHPTLLRGYGAYGLTSWEPRFTPAMIPWIERGGVHAFCHVRGDGDYGEEWHRAGQKENKPNTIADFIACGEYLVTEGYTTSARLAGMGESAGGPTIGGAITRRPDLFAVTLHRAAFSDLLRLEFGRNGPQQIQEFGTVTDPDDFRAMAAVSPYHHITPGTRYPAVLAMTGINDDTVPPWHVAKLVARLQAATTSGKPVLLRVDWAAGHTGSSDPEAQTVDRDSFLLWQMGIPEFQPTQSAGPLIVQAPRKAIKSASDLPAFRYPVTGNPNDLTRSEEAFRPFAEKLRPDIESLLRDYSIEDRPTLRGFHQTLLALDLLDNRTEEARKEVAIIRDLEDKPEAKLMSGLVEGALLDSGGPKPDPREFLRSLSAALNRLPWDVVGDLAKQWKARFEQLKFAAWGANRTQPGSPNQTPGGLNLRGAQGTVMARYALAILSQVANEATEAFATYVAAHHSGPPPAPVVGYEVVNVYPHDPQAFTEGLVYLDGYLYEGTGLNGRSSLRKVKLENGEVLQIQKVDDPQDFGEGIAVWKDRIFQLTWKGGRGFIYDRASFRRIGTFNYTGEGWGLTQDGTRIIMSDGSSLRFLDPQTLKEMGRLQVTDGGVPVVNLNELEFVKGTILANIYGQTERIARISPRTGEVIQWIDLRGLLDPRDAAQGVNELNGIAYDAAHDRLFVTGKLWPKLFEIKVKGQ